MSATAIAGTDSAVDKLSPIPSPAPVLIARASAKRPG